MSNQDECGATAAVGCREDEQDPLGILGGASDFHDGALKHAGGSRHHFESPAEIVQGGGDCGENRDPREVIDAILRSSRAIRDRVSSRQVSQHQLKDKYGDAACVLCLRMCVHADCLRVGG